MRRRQNKSTTARVSARVIAALLAASVAWGGVTGVALADHGGRENSYVLATVAGGLPYLVTPVPYLYVDQLDGLYKPSGAFKNPADLFIDHQGFMWIADTGNNRVLKYDLQGTFLLEVGAEEGDGKLNAPEGVFVDAKGNIWVADRGNGRIAQYDAKGTYMLDLRKPRSKLLEEDQVYQPSKLLVDKRGYIYVLNGGGDYRGMFLLDSEGEFRGFFAANRLVFDVMRFLTRVLTTEQQKKQISKVLPTHHANIFLEERGFIYAVSPLAHKDQIKKFNQVGKNVYKDDKFFGERERRGNQNVLPQFSDISVDTQGIVSALDFQSGRIYQYDQDGNLLGIFGGRGSQQGKFELPASLAGTPDGNLYVLDANRNNVQMFRPTEYATLIHQASRLYYDGFYTEAAEKWRQVLRRNTNFELAHTGVAKSYFKQGEYVRSMEEYALARNKDGYSKAFAEWRHDFLRENFGWVLPAVVFLIWLSFTLVVRTIRKVMSLNLTETEGRLA